MQRPVASRRIHRHWYALMSGTAHLIESQDGSYRFGFLGAADHAAGRLVGDLADDLARWIAFESFNIICGDAVACPACEIGVLNDDDSGGFWCDICDEVFHIED